MVYDRRYWRHKNTHAQHACFHTKSHQQTHVCTFSAHSEGRRRISRCSGECEYRVHTQTHQPIQACTFSAHSEGRRRISRCSGEYPSAVGVSKAQQSPSNPACAALIAPVKWKRPFVNDQSVEHAQREHDCEDSSNTKHRSNFLIVRFVNTVDTNKFCITVNTTTTLNIHIKTSCTFSG